MVYSIKSEIMKILREGDVSAEDAQIFKSWLQDNGIELSKNSIPLGYISRNEETYFILPKVYREDKFEDARNFYLALKKCKNSRQGDSNIFFSAKGQKMSGRSSSETTRFETELALLLFQREHSDWLRTTIYNSRRGKKISWRKTICHTRPLIMQCKNSNSKKVLYTDFRTKKREAEYDDSLMVLYYSILNYLSKNGYNVNANFNFDVIPPNRFKEKHIDQGLGLTLLRQIRHKYFDNLSLELWNLCRDFFECRSHSGREANYHFLLVTQLNTIFEQIIDELLCKDSEIDDAIANSKEGRRLDHIWIDDDPIIEGHRCIYIADSKYYLDKIDEVAIHKQFVYPRNVVDNILMAVDEKYQRYRDFVYDNGSCGYFLLPNCIVRSAGLENGRSLKSIDESILGITHKYHHRDRLFDRNTMPLVGIDIDLGTLFDCYKDKSSYRFDELGKEIRAKIKELIREWIEARFERSSGPTTIGRYIDWNGKRYCFVPKGI